MSEANENTGMNREQIRNYGKANLPKKVRVLIAMFAERSNLTVEFCTGLYLSEPPSQRKNARDKFRKMIRMIDSGLIDPAEIVEGIAS